MKKLSDPILYTLWAAMFVLTAALGLLFPAAAGADRWALMAVSVIFFLPPWLLLVRAWAEQNRKTILLIRYLSFSSVGLTALLLVLNLRSAGMGEAVGAALNAALTIVSAPLVCSNFFVLPLFLWGTLIAGTFVKK